MYPLFNILTLEQKIEELSKQVKRPYYQGRPTRKQKQLEKLYNLSDASYVRYAQYERKKML
jgi:hypothetical protein